MSLQVRTFIAEQYKLTGLNLHPENSPTAFIKQADGRITVVYRGAATGDKDIEIKDNDCVLLATGAHRVDLCVRVCMCICA